MATFIIVASLAIVFAWLLSSHTKRINVLTRRLSDLETRLEQQSAPAPKPARAAAESIPAPAVTVAPAPPSVELEPTPAAKPPPPLAEPNFLDIQFRRLKDYLRESLRGGEWEAIVGGSWLNKIGVLVLVVGIALFIGYSLTRLGPGGRIAVGIGVALAMLAGGIVVERRERYLVFARGLIGGGWAALYFSTFALHGLEAARIIENPLLAGSLLLAVAAAMIFHLLRYRSELVSGLTYVVAYVTLIISPLSLFSLIASLPLAVSLLAVAYHYSWHRMAVGGVIATYGFYAFHLVKVEVVEVELSGFMLGISILSVYWLLFEAFDLASHLRRRQDDPAARALFPLNGCGFLGIAILQWSAFDPVTRPYLFAGAATAYLASALVRAKLRPPSAFAEKQNPLLRGWFGSYEWAVILAAVLTVATIFQGFSGWRINVALLLEGQLLFLAGLSLRQLFLRQLGGLVLIVPVLKLAYDISIPGSDVYIADFFHAFRAWSPFAVLTATVFYLNRFLLRNKTPLPVYDYGYSFVASAVVLVVVGFEAEAAPIYIGVLWWLFGMLLLEVSRHAKFPEFRFQAYGAGALGFGALALLYLFRFEATADPFPWDVLVAATLLGYASAVRLYFPLPSHIPPSERAWARDAASAMGTAALAVLLWHVLPVSLVAVGWMVMALLLTWVGFRLNLPALRIEGNAMAAVAFGRLFMANFTDLSYTWLVSHRLLTVVPLIIALYNLSIQYREARERGGLAKWENGAARLYFYAPFVLMVVLIRFELGRVAAVVGWAVLAVALLALARRLGNRDLRWQGYLMALLIFARGWATNFNIPEGFWGVSGRIATGAITIGALYSCQFLAPKAPKEPPPPPANIVLRYLGLMERHGRSVFSLLGSILLAVLLYYEVSGGWLTVAWALEATALLAGGFLLREQTLRLTGLFMLLICILKLFAFDLRGMEMPFRILSFVFLGVLLIGISWVYTRFREQIKKYLVDE